MNNIVKEERTKSLCNDNLENCFCWEEKGHDALHICRCSGSWDDKKVPHSLPDISRGFGAFPLMGYEKDMLEGL